MKTITKKYFLCLFILASGLVTSCDNGFEELNTSVDFVSDPNIDFMLPDIELTLMDNTYYTHGDFAAPFVMHVTNRNSFEALTIPGGYHG